MTVRPCMHQQHAFVARDTRDYTDYSAILHVAVPFRQCTIGTYHKGRKLPGEDELHEPRPLVLSPRPRLSDPPGLREEASSRALTTMVMVRSMPFSSCSPRGRSSSMFDVKMRFKWSPMASLEHRHEIANTAFSGQ